MDQNLTALYEIKRQAFLFAYIQNPDRFNNALAYAHYHRVAPIFHEVILREAYGLDPFADAYVVKSDFVNDVTKFIDDCERAGNYDAIEFGRLEDKFGGYKSQRMELVHILEYSRITGLFDEKVWKAIEHRAPIEANNLIAEFTPNDVEFG